mgnify:CR=1 FL=1
MEDIVIVSAARTAVGKFGGSLAKVAATELGSIAINAALERAKLTGDALAEASGQVIMGQVLAAGAGQNTARQALIKAGLPNDYIKPDEARVIAHSKVIGGGETTSVKIPVAKLGAGPYSFFCSFPGPAALMKGTLTVK